MKVIGIVQARMASTRLPGKVLAPLAGHPLLAVVLRRVARAAVDEWWLATTVDPRDDVTAAWGDELGAGVHRGDPDDVLSRFTAVVRERQPEWVVRLTADDPFVDAGVVDALLAAAASAPDPVRVVGPDPAAGLPLGYVPQVVLADALLRAEAEIPPGAPHHRAHVLSWFAEGGRAAGLDPPAGWPRRPGWRWTVDTPEDLAMARQAFAAFGPRWEDLGYEDMVAVLDGRPDIVATNLHVEQKAPGEG